MWGRFSFADEVGVQLIPLEFCQGELIPPAMMAELRPVGLWLTLSTVQVI